MLNDYDINKKKRAKKQLWCGDIVLCNVFDDYL